MSDLLAVDTVTAHASARDEEDAAVLRRRIPDLLDRATRRDLGSAVTLRGEGHTCLRRLDVPLVLDPDQPDSTTSAAWGRALAQALQEAVGRPDVVRYPTTADALADLVAGAAGDGWERAWAWRQVGILPAARGDDDEPAPPSRPAARDLVLRSLAASPEYAAAAMGSALRSVGVAVLTRLLGGEGWRELALVLAAAVGSDVLPLRPGHTRRDVAVPEGLATYELFASSSLRVAPGDGAAWATIALAVDAPQLLRGAERSDLVAALAAGLERGTEDARPKRRPTRLDHVRRDPRRTSRGDGPGSEEGPDGDPPPAVHRPGETPTAGTADGPVTHDEDVEAPPYARPGTEPQDDGAERTAGDGSETGDDVAAELSRHAGLLFLLATTEEAGVPELLVGDPALARRPLTWTVPAVARRVVGTPAADPVLLVLSGGTEPDDGWRPEPGPESRAVREAARRWRRVTADRLRAAGVAEAPDRALARRAVLRHGLIARRRAWVDVQLDLSGVDVLVRTAGLDLDPGWVPWLGCVVRYRYE